MAGKPVCRRGERRSEDLQRTVGADLNNDAEPGCLSSLLAPPLAIRPRVAPRSRRTTIPARSMERGTCCAGGAALRCGHGLPDGPAWQTPCRIPLAPLTAALIRRELCELDEVPPYLDMSNLPASIDGHAIGTVAAAVRHHGSTDGA